MNFENHSKLSGLHAPFSASQSSWLRYDDEKLLNVYRNKQAAALGTKLHDWAKTTIDLGIKQPRSKKTLSAYVNDAIGFRMSTEVVLYYSNYFFGTADAICFRDNILRIHDLKTGVGPVHIEQLMIYAALFCLEYKVKPHTLDDIILRIYQNDDCSEEHPEPEVILEIMDRIKYVNKMLESEEYKED